jgi:predicted component of type VI protein secretion system
MQPSVKESIENALEALRCHGYHAGGAIYDDLAQLLKDLEPDILERRLSA